MLNHYNYLIKYYINKYNIIYLYNIYINKQIKYIKYNYIGYMLQLLKFTLFFFILYNYIWT